MQMVVAEYRVHQLLIHAASPGPLPRTVKRKA
jgi:hypothetical protein